MLRTLEKRQASNENISRSVSRTRKIMSFLCYSVRIPAKVLLLLSSANMDKPLLSIETPARGCFRALKAKSKFLVFRLTNCGVGDSDSMPGTP